MAAFNLPPSGLVYRNWEQCPESISFGDGPPMRCEGWAGHEEWHKFLTYANEGSIMISWPSGLHGFDEPDVL